MEHVNGDNGNGNNIIDDRSIVALDKLLTNFLHVVLKPGTSLYEEENGRFWNRDNSNIRPSIIVTPSTAQETADIVKILSESKTGFAIRSGGYMPVPSFNTSPSVLVSLSSLNSVSILSHPSHDTELVKFGSGSQWGSVYDVLEPRGLVVPGGRCRPLGVGGFLLYGGVSHIYGQVGWSCEWVMEFEVALADGHVVLANEKKNAELYWALKGGGNNFGIVTAFTMKTMKLSKMWGGVRMVVGAPENMRKVVDNIHEQLKVDVDEKAMVEMISLYNPGMCQSGDPMIVLALAYAAEEEQPAAMRGFLEVDSVHDGTRIATQRELADDDKQSIGYDKRGLFRAFAYRGEPEMTRNIFNEYYSLVKESGIHEQDPTAIAMALWMPAGRNLSSGSGVVSLGEEVEPYLACNLVFRWEKPEVSEKIHVIADTITEKLKAKLRDADALVTFTYANLAGVQDFTYAKLPEKTRETLLKVATQYDPQGVFQNQVPGFKLM